MILVAAVAFSDVRSRSAVQRAMGSQPFWTGNEAKLTLISGGFAIVGSVPMMATFALTAMYLGPPRPHQARLMRRPGWIACLAGSTGLLLGLAIDWADSPLRRSDQSGDQYMLHQDMKHPTYVTLMPGSSILSSWLILIVGGTGEVLLPGWTEPGGR